MGAPNERNQAGKGTFCAIGANAGRFVGNGAFHVERLTTFGDIVAWNEPMESVCARRVTYYLNLAFMRITSRGGSIPSMVRLAVVFGKMVPTRRSSQGTHLPLGAKSRGSVPVWLPNELLGCDPFQYHLTTLDQPHGIGWSKVASFPP